MSKEPTQWDQDENSDIDPTKQVLPADEASDPVLSEEEAIEKEQSAQKTVENELKAQISMLQDQLLRTQAEAQNMQNRYEKKIVDATKYAIQEFAKELLSVIDNFERALSESSEKTNVLFEGVQRTYELLLKVFNKFDLQPIDPNGKNFDPELHEAISTTPAANEAQSNKVVQVLQKGYLLNNRLIRPALVIVAKSS